MASLVRSQSTRPRGWSPRRCLVELCITNTGSIPMALEMISTQALTALSFMAASAVSSRRVPAGNQPLELSRLREADFRRPRAARPLLMLTSPHRLPDC